MQRQPAGGSRYTTPSTQEARAAAARARRCLLRILELTQGGGETHLQAQQALAALQPPVTSEDTPAAAEGATSSSSQRNPPRPITTGLWGATTAKPPGNGGEPARDSLRHHSGTQRDGGRRPNRGRGTRPEADSAPHTGRQQTVPHSPQGEGLGRSPWRRKLYRAGQ